MTRKLIGTSTSPHPADDPSHDQRAMRGRAATFILKRLRTIALLTLLASLAGYFGQMHRVLELTCHFRLQYLWSSAFCALALLLGRDWKGLAIASIPLIANAVAVLPWYFGAAPGNSSGTAVRVLLSNVYTANPNTAAVLDLIRRENPDLVVLQEVDDRWVTELQPLSVLLPHSRIVPREDNFGIGIWSRYPLAEVQEIESGDYQIPSIFAQVQVPGRSLRVLATHPPPPVRTAAFDDRNAQLGAMAKLLKSTPEPVVLLGDLNLTMWSPFYRDFVGDSGLRNARKGFGILPTWPTQIPFMGIPLDQCLVSPGIGVKSIKRAQPIGSDHRPVVADLNLPR